MKVKVEDEEAVVNSLVTSPGDQLLLVDKFVGDAVCGRLCRALKLNPTHSKKLVNLRGNCIGYLGSVAIAELLEANTLIQTLILEWNNVGHSTAAVGVIASALERNSRLLHLDLRNNHVDDDDATALARAIATNEALQKLDLRWNNISDAGAVALLTAAQQRTTHIEIQLTGNRVTEALEKSITTACGPARPSKARHAVEQNLPGDQSVAETTSHQPAVHRPQAVAPTAQHERRHENEHELKGKVSPQYLVPQPMHTEPVSTDALQSYAAAWVDERRQMERSAAAERQALEAQLREAAANTVALESELLSTQTRLTQTEDALAIERERLEELRKELAATKAAHEQEKAELLQQVRRHDREMSGVRLDAEAKAARAAEAETSSQQKIQAVQQQLQEAQDANARLETESVRMKARLNALEDSLKASTNECDKLRALQATHERSSEDARQSLQQRLKEAQEQFDTKLAVAEQRAAQLAKENVGLTEKLQRLESQIVTWEAQKVRDISAAIRQAREEERSRREDQIVELKMQVEGLITAHRDSETRAEELSHELKRLNHDSVAQIQELESRASILQADLQAAKHEMETERARCKTATSELRSAQSELEASKDLVARLRHERTALERDVESLRNKLSVAHREEAKQWEATVNDLRHQLLEAEAKLTAANQQLAENRRNEQEYLRTIESALLGSVQRQIVDVLAAHPKR